MKNRKKKLAVVSLAILVVFISLYLCWSYFFGTKAINLEQKFTLYTGQTAKIVNTDTSIHLTGFSTTDGTTQPNFEWQKGGRIISNNTSLEYSLSYENTDFKTSVSNIRIKKYTDIELRRNEIYRNLNPASGIQL